MRLLRLYIMLAALAPLCLAAQKLTYDVDFRSVFDNREGDHTYNETRTFFQTQLAPQVGVEFGNNRISGGVVWTQPIGSSWDGYHIEPTLFYRYTTPRLRASMGFFPRTQLIEQMPVYLWSDSLNYSQANIRGAMVQYQSSNGFFEAFLDWRGMQSEKVREAFSIQAHGMWQRADAIFIAGGTAMLNHLAKSKNSPQPQYIVDNMVANAWVGVDLSQRCALDSLQLRVGPLMSINRYRKFDNWTAPAGVFAHFHMAWRWLSLTDYLYAGGILMPYYSEFLTQLHMGEPFFQSKFYNRTNIAANLISNSHVCLQASLVFNLAQNCFNFYQRLAVRFYFASSPTPTHLPLLY